MVILDGNLTQDPETKKTPTEKNVTTFTIALNHEWGSKDGNKTVSFIPVETWEKLAENCSAYLKKGSRVTISGDLRQDRWKDSEGKTHSRVKVIARTVRFDSTKNKKSAEAEAAA